MDLGLGFGTGLWLDNNYLFINLFLVLSVEVIHHFNDDFEDVCDDDIDITGFLNTQDNCDFIFNPELSSSHDNDGETMTKTN